MQSPITIRKAASIEDYRALQEAQRKAWGITEENYIVPVATMIGAQHHGGLVLGAFLENGEAAGMSFAFLGRIGGRICLYSQLTGIAPEYQGRGIGGDLKKFQHEYALNNDIDLIAWAFDPLQAGNARFNIDKLGATCRRYYENMYGLRTDALNDGVPTDRLIAEWEIRPAPSTGRHSTVTRDLPRLIRTEDRGVDGVAPVGLDESLEHPELLLEIPESISTLRRDRPIDARNWGRFVRDAFLAAFGRGYAAAGFVRESIGETNRCYYQLSRQVNGADS